MGSKIRAAASTSSRGVTKPLAKYVLRLISKGFSSLTEKVFVRWGRKWKAVRVEKKGRKEA